MVIGLGKRHHDRHLAQPVAVAGLGGRVEVSEAQALAKADAEVPVVVAEAFLEDGQEVEGVELRWEPEGDFGFCKSWGWG